MRLAFAGTPTAAVTVLDALLASHHEIDVVVTRPDAPAGRGKVLTESAVARAARAAGLECLKPARISDEAARLASVDCVVVVAYGGLVPTAMLEASAHGFLNVHYSLLPAWRGAAPVQHAILRGDAVTGATVFKLDAGLDTGPVLGSVTTDIGARETATQLLERLSGMGAHVLLRVLDALEQGVAVAAAQTDDGMSHAPKVTTSDARIQWSHPALAVDRLVRAMSDAPGAWTMAGDERIKIAPVMLRPDTTDLIAGHVVHRDGEVLVGTATHAVALTRVLRAGKSWAQAGAWLDDRTLI